MRKGGYGGYLGRRTIIITAVAASFAAAGYSYAGVRDRGTRALAALETEHCPFAALRAAFAPAPGASPDKAAKTEAALATAFDDPWQRADIGSPHSARQTCPQAGCPLAAGFQALRMK